MRFIFEQPAVTYACLVLAAFALLLEAALPTVGVAGTISAVLTTLGVIGVARQQLSWWPLLLAAAGVAIWAVMLAARRAKPWGQVLAAVLYAAGSLWFTLASKSTAALIVSLVAIAGFPAVFPFLKNATTKLMDAPPDVGMDSLVGKTARVVRWNGREGTVAVGGAMWSAQGPEGLKSGEKVPVTGFDGMELSVGSAGEAAPAAAAVPPAADATG